MKRFFSTISSFLLVSFLMTGPTWAGINYIRYNEDFQAQKGMKGSEDTKHLEHKSKTERDTKEKMVTPTQEKGTQNPSGKYDRRYWNPTE